MKKSVLILVIIFLEIIACIFLNDGWIYLMSSLMALAVISTITSSRRWVMKITRWAKENSLKAQVLITVLQLALLSLAIMAGYNFKKLGYEFSNTTPFVFSAIMVFGFLSVPFLPKRRMIAIPKEVNRHRLAFMSIALSSFVLMVVFGNRIEESYPNSLITRTVTEIDEAIFPTNCNVFEHSGDIVSEPVYPQNLDPASTNETSGVAVFASFSGKEKATASEKKASRLEKKQLKMMKRLEKYRLAFAGGISVGAVLLIIFLVPVLCAGICLIIFGISGEIGAGYILLGALVAGGSVWGMIKAAKGSKRKNNTTP